jgi:hypothetical protein
MLEGSAQHLSRASPVRRPWRRQGRPDQDGQHCDDEPPMMARHLRLGRQRPRAARQGSSGPPCRQRCRRSAWCLARVSASSHPPAGALPLTPAHTFPQLRVAFLADSDRHWPTLRRSGVVCDGGLSGSFAPGSASRPSRSPPRRLGSGVRTSAPRIMTRTGLGTRRSSRCIRLLARLGSKTYMQDRIRAPHRHAAASRTRSPLGSCPIVDGGPVVVIACSRTPQSRQRDAV